MAHEASARPPRHRHSACTRSRTLQDRRRQGRRSAHPSPIGGGRAHARRTAIHKHTISGRAARGRSEPPWVDHRHVASGAPTPLTDARNRWSSQPTGSIRIESKLRLSPRVREPGLNRGDFRQLSMIESMPENRSDQAGRVGLWTVAQPRHDTRSGQRAGRPAIAGVAGGLGARRHERDAAAQRGAGGRYATRGGERGESTAGRDRTARACTLWRGGARGGMDPPIFGICYPALQRVSGVEMAT